MTISAVRGFAGRWEEDVSALAALVARGFEQPVDQRHGQSDDVEIAALDALDEFRGPALDGVGAGLVHGLSAGGIVEHFLVRQDVYKRQSS